MRIDKLGGSNMEKDNESPVVIKDEKDQAPASTPVFTHPVVSSVDGSHKLGNVTEASAFTDMVDQAKINVVHEASQSDEKFVGDFKGKLKEATLKLAEVEKSKAELEKQNVEYHSELLKTQQLLNEQQQAQDKWENRQKRRQYHYNGVKDIMLSVGVKEPMNLFFLYLLTIIVLPFFLLGKLIRCTFGNLIAGACNEDRPKAVKGALWTILFVSIALVLALLVILALGWFGVIKLPMFN